MITLYGPHSPSMDDVVARELRSAGIGLVVAEQPVVAEVKTRVTGRLGGLKFMRAWCFWRVGGLVPLEMAREMFQHPAGRFIRVDGDCGCLRPEERAVRIQTSRGVVEVVSDYHIDGQEGLNLFADMARKYRLDVEPLVVVAPNGAQEVDAP